MLIVAAKRGMRPYVAIWCEHHEDFLAERQDGVFDGYQIKTSRPERGAWRLTDAELTKSIGRFVDLVAEFGDQIGELYFVTNTEFDTVTPENDDDRRRGRCPQLFLQHVRGCPSKADVRAPFDNSFEELQATCGCDGDQLLAIIRRMNLVLGPSRVDFDAALSHEHLARLRECSNLNAQELDTVRDELVAIVHRASSLQVTDPIRHLRPLMDARVGDPLLAAKRIVIADVIISSSHRMEPVPFRFPGAPRLELGVGVSTVLDQKLMAAGLEADIDYMRERALAAEYNLLEDVHRRPEGFSELLRQIEQRVHGELSEAHLSARQQSPPYGPAMLIDAQNRLRRLAENRPGDVGHHGYECLIGIAGLLTSECRVWWSPRFPIGAETPE
jgi:hypothetical protein